MNKNVGVDVCWNINYPLRVAHNQIQFYFNIIPYGTVNNVVRKNNIMFERMYKATMIELGIS